MQFSSVQLRPGTCRIPNPDLSLIYLSSVTRLLSGHAHAQPCGSLDPRCHYYVWPWLRARGAVVRRSGLCPAIWKACMGPDQGLRSSRRRYFVGLCDDELCARRCSPGTPWCIGQLVATLGDLVRQGGLQTALEEVRKPIFRRPSPHLFFLSANGTESRRPDNRGFRFVLLVVRTGLGLQEEIVLTVCPQMVKRIVGTGQLLTTSDVGNVTQGQGVLDHEASHIGGVRHF